MSRRTKARSTISLARRASQHDARSITRSPRADVRTDTPITTRRRRYCASCGEPVHVLLVKSAPRASAPTRKAGRVGELRDEQQRRETDRARAAAARAARARGPAEKRAGSNGIATSVVRRRAGTRTRRDRRRSAAARTSPDRARARDGRSRRARTPCDDRGAASDRLTAQVPALPVAGTRRRSHRGRAARRGNNDVVRASKRGSARRRCGARRGGP